MLRPLTPAVLLILIACSSDVAPVAREDSRRVPAAPARDLYALGTALTEEGAVPRDAASEVFRRGGELYLSVNVTGASTDQQIEVQWLDPRGNVIRRDAAQIPRGSRFAAFSTGETATWREGEHRAVVIINGRKVSERPFGMM